VAYAGTDDNDDDTVTADAPTPLLFGSYPLLLPPNEEGAEGYRDDDDEE
jgi:hypothetical protein